jgi:hypothetical protein
MVLPPGSSMPPFRPCGPADSEHRGFLPRSCAPQVTSLTIQDRGHCALGGCPVRESTTLTVRTDGNLFPCLSHARFFLGRRDWYSRLLPRVPSGHVLIHSRRSRAFWSRPFFFFLFFPLFRPTSLFRLDPEVGIGHSRRSCLYFLVSILLSPHPQPLPYIYPLTYPFPCPSRRARPSLRGCSLAVPISIILCMYYLPRTHPRHCLLPKDDGR